MNIVFCVLAYVISNWFLRFCPYIHAFVHFFKNDLNNNIKKNTVHLRDLCTPGLLFSNHAVISLLSNNSFLSNAFATWPNAKPSMLIW